MTKEELENDIINTLFECTHSGEDGTISDKEFAEVLADKFINHETDLLKEFVEWLDKKNCIYSFLDGCYLVFDGKSLLNEFLEERK
jgi:2-hydroxy-3-keto-5-methylthiopentenyl-1-phosphate phosphatase